MSQPYAFPTSTAPTNSHSPHPIHVQHGTNTFRGYPIGKGCYVLTQRGRGGRSEARLIGRLRPRPPLRPSTPRSLPRRASQYEARTRSDMISMNDPAVGMIPFDGIGLYDQQPKPRFIFKMPRVVPDQKAKFESDELFRRLSRESEVRYTGYRDRPTEERQIRFQNGCREGHTEAAFVATGTNMQLVFSPSTNGYHLPGNRDCDFEKEHGKVHIRSHFIMNGVCVRWRGWIDLDRLDGVGCLEFDEEKAMVEDAMLRDQIERYRQKLREFEERQRAYSGQPRDHDLELRLGGGGGQAQQRCQRLSLQVGVVPP